MGNPQGIEKRPGTEQVYMDEYGELLLQQFPDRGPKDIYRIIKASNQYRIDLCEMRYLDISTGESHIKGWRIIPQEDYARVRELINALRRNYGFRLVYIAGLKSIAKARGREYPLAHNANPTIAEVITAILPLI